jgi:2-oxoglutarate dehydrogenase E2 component (dihydrolipoamide succinyltransferase)
MTIEIRIPEVGESIEEVTLEQWLKKEGDPVAEDEPIAILESDKVTIELPAPESGTLGSIDRQAGEQCGIGDVIGHLEPASDSPDTGEQTDEKSGDAEAEEPSGPKSADREPENRSPGEDRRSGSDKPQKSDKAQKEEKPPAKETRQTGEKRQEREKRQTGEKRRREDRATEDEHRGEQGTSDGGESREPAGPERREEVVPMSPVRLRIAERLLEAQRSAPILTTFNKADMSRVLELRKRYQDGFRKRHDVKLGIMSFFVKATVAALRRIPELNAEVRDQNIVYRNYSDIGIAIA